MKKMDSYLEALEWRYATKQFDADKKIEDANLEILKEAVRLSASSYGLQPYEVIIVESAEVKAALKEAAWGQSQITDASHLFIFANNVHIGDSQIDHYIDNISQTRHLNLEALEGFSQMMKGKLSSFSEDAKNTWTSKQTYIALGNLLSAAAHLHIDTCPMEGFEPAKFNAILGLDKKGLNASVIAAVGYRSENDAAQHYTKVRKPESELFTTI